MATGAHRLGSLLAIRCKTRRGGIPHVQTETAKSWPRPQRPGSNITKEHSREPDHDAQEVRPSTTRQRTSGRGQAWTLPGLRPWHQPASFDVLTHDVRPHVARTDRSVFYGCLSVTGPSQQIF